MFKSINQSIINQSKSIILGHVKQQNVVTPSRVALSGHFHIFIFRILYTLSHYFRIIPLSQFTHVHFRTLHFITRFFMKQIKRLKSSLQKFASTVSCRALSKTRRDSITGRDAGTAAR